ncbi:hypothetical protein DVH24_035666 [Malus domestica]|uniref:Lipoyl-binding domain-containing protein n=1 Tax=Malus domestica TaxID=3750 RepID=A0A498JMM7_MALDO|nr:hypothetical protein DVH24_035666 [Malus domestica]
MFVELTDAGRLVSQGGSFGAVESVKATNDVNSPISGEINLTSYEDGWMIKIKPSSPSELESFLGPKEYTKFCEEEDATH